MTSGAGDGSEDGSEKNVKQENVDSANISTEVRIFVTFILFINGKILIYNKIDAKFHHAFLKFFKFFW